MMNLAALQGVLRELNLCLIQVEDWILVQRANFDLHVADEPYHSIQLYANLTTRKYVIRVWGRTYDWGAYDNEEYLNDLCVTNFKDTAACLGYLGPHPGSGLQLVQVNFPCSRWISKSCVVRFAQSSDDLIVGLCPSCSSDKLGIKKEDSEEEEGEEYKVDPVGAPNDSSLKQEFSTADPLSEENEVVRAEYQSPDDSNLNIGKNLGVSIGVLQG